MFHCSARSGRRVLLDLLQSLHIARNPDLRDMASELDSKTIINGVAYFYEKRTSGENFRKRNKFQLIVMHPDEDKFSVWLSFVAAVTVFAVNNDAVCVFLPHICAVLRFFNPPYVPLCKQSKLRITRFLLERVLLVFDLTTTKKTFCN